MFTKPCFKHCLGYILLETDPEKWYAVVPLEILLLSTPMRGWGKQDWSARQSEYHSDNKSPSQCHGELGSLMTIQSCPELKQEDQTKIKHILDLCWPARCGITLFDAVPPGKGNSQRRTHLWAGSCQFPALVRMNFLVLKWYLCGDPQYHPYVSLWTISPNPHNHLTKHTLFYPTL